MTKKKEKMCLYCGKSEKTGGAWLEHTTKKDERGNDEVYFRSRKLHLTDRRGVHALCKLFQHLRKGR